MNSHDRDQDNRDTLKRFLFERFDVSGKLVHLDASWRAIDANGDYPPAIREVLGQAAAATALLASTLKFEGKLTMQLHGAGALSMLVMQCTNTLALRGMARWSGDNPQGSFAALAGQGRLVFTIDANSEGQRYQGIVSASGETLAECIQAYFETSEQLPTRLWLAANESRAVGMLLQKMPATSQSATASDDDAWPRVQMLADTVTASELLELPDRDVLRRLFNEEDLREFEPVPVSFRCRCSETRVADTLRGLGEDEVTSILQAEGSVAVTCEFCNRAYTFDDVDIAALFAGDAAPGPPTLQ